MGLVGPAFNFFRKTCSRSEALSANVPGLGLNGRFSLLASQATLSSASLTTDGRPICPRQRRPNHTRYQTRRSLGNVGRLDLIIGQASRKVLHPLRHHFPPKEAILAARSR